MASIVQKLIATPAFQLSLSGIIARKVIKSTDRFLNYSPEFLLKTQGTVRPHYAYCLWTAADLARRLGIKRISALEFGVAGGNGLQYMYEFGQRIERALGVGIDCYGFDTGAGMPPPTGPMDLPYWFRENAYRMDPDALRKRLPGAKLVLGDIKETVKTFFAEHDPAPIGVMLNDADYYSSTLDSFALFDSVDVTKYFLPRIPMYFDDINGSGLEMYGPFNGEMAAVSDFNQAHSTIKIHLNQNLLPQPHLRYRYAIYYAHLFEHPQYSTYIGGEEQQALEQWLRLQSS